MYLIFKEFHSYVAFLLLVVLMLVIVVAIYGWVKVKPYNKIVSILSLVGLGAAQSQFTIGLILYFISPLGMSNFSGDAMKNALSRLYIAEHPLMMLLAIVLVTIGYIKTKKAKDDNSKYKNMAIYYSIGLAFILSRIPWQMWL
jgi:cytochrome b561